MVLCHALKDKMFYHVGVVSSQSLSSIWYFTISEHHTSAVCCIVSLGIYFLNVHLPQFIKYLQFSSIQVQFGNYIIIIKYTRFINAIIIMYVISTATINNTINNGVCNN